MIKINVIVKDKTWLKFIKNPETYLKKKIKIIQKNKKFKKKKYHFSVFDSKTIRRCKNIICHRKQLNSLRKQDSVK